MPQTGRHVSRHEGGQAKEAPFTQYDDGRGHRMLVVSVAEAQAFSAVGACPMRCAGERHFLRETAKSAETAEGCDLALGR